MNRRTFLQIMVMGVLVPPVFLDSLTKPSPKEALQKMVNDKIDRLRYNTQQGWINYFNELGI